jgi:hypothetical protein
MQQERSLFVLWGPSCVSIGRHLPRILSLNLYKQKKYEVVIKADSGQEIAEPLVDEIIVFISKHYPRKQVHLIILREGVFSFFENLEKRTRDIPNCHLILSSLIPSPKTAAICEGTFKKIDCNIKSITDIRNRDLAYFDANRILRNPDGSIKIELFEDDGVHLTEKGTDELSKEIRKFVMRVSNKCFPENPMQFRPNQEVKAEKQKHFKYQITMKAGFIFPKPVPSTNYRH